MVHFYRLTNKCTTLVKNNIATILLLGLTVDVAAWFVVHAYMHNNYSYSNLFSSTETLIKVTLTYRSLDYN